MSEFVIFTVLVSVMFGLPAYLFSIVLKHCPVKPEGVMTPAIMAERETKDNIPEVKTNRAALVELPETQPSASKDAVRVKHLHTLEGHRKILRDALENAVRRVMIVSPVMSSIAVNADQVDTLVRGAVTRGVEVLVFTDRSLNAKKDGTETPTSVAGRAMLENAGAKVFVVNRAHNKTLSVDDSVIIEGSFNWLSASRDETHEHQRKENSTMIIGGDSSMIIAEELETMIRMAA